MRIDQLTDTPWPHSRTGGLLRDTTAAELAGMSVYLFRKGCTQGEIPLDLVTVGRFQFVRASQFNGWLAPQAPAGAPLSLARAAQPAAANLFE
jgi:hypothetical protein